MDWSDSSIQTAATTAAEKNGCELSFISRFHLRLIETKKTATDEEWARVMNGLNVMQENSEEILSLSRYLTTYREKKNMIFKMILEQVEWEKRKIVAREI